MGKIHLGLILLLVFIIILVSCNDKTDDSQDVHEIRTILNPVYSIANYNKDMMFQKPYDKDLSEGVSLIFHNAEFTVLCYSSAINEYGYIPLEIKYKQGINDGKIIFKEYSNSREYKVGLMNYDFSIHTEAIYSDIEFAGENQAIIKNNDGYGVLDFKNGTLIPCQFNYKPILISNYILIPVDKSKSEEMYSIHNRADGQFLYLFKKIYTENENIEYVIVNSAGQEESITDVSKYIPDTLTPYKDKETRYYGYRNKFGEIVIDSLYLYADIFLENRARVRLGDNWGFIDKGGEIVISCIYEKVSSFNNGIARVVYDNQRIFIDMEGNAVDYFDYFIIKQFAEGLAPAILIQEDHWRYVNEYGEVAFNGYYSKAGEFSHGLASVMSPDPVVYGSYDSLAKNYYYIDTEGVPVFGLLIFQEAYKLNDEGYGFAWSMGSEQRFDNVGNEYGVTAFKYYVIISRNNRFFNIKTYYI